ncbi:MULTISPECIES: hypothetical protein [Ruminococcus]|uniref:hypothetical protein n=1 Tax=Ruminococcus TaxID=1263 RepID=UPI0003365FBC|nr:MULTISPECIES: hypothetical protein [Ruminococcus]CDD53055.1 putative uncharacterized protein [Ruminococcus sp. CAG:379]
MQKPHQLMHELTGLFLDKNTGVYFGTYGGFSVFIKPVENRMEISAGFPDAATTTGNLLLLQSALDSIPGQHKYMQTCQYNDSTRQVVCTWKQLAQSVKKNGEMYAAFLDSILSVLRNFNMHSCCNLCGSEQSLDYYCADGHLLVACPSCLNRLEQELGSKRETASMVPEDRVHGILGAAIGALVLALMTWLLWEMGYVAYITGFVGMTVAVTLYKKFAGKISMVGAVICAVMCLVFSVGTNYFCVAKEFVKVFADDGKYVQAVQQTKSELEAAAADVYNVSDEDIKLYSEDYNSKDEFIAAYNNALSTCKTELEFAKDHQSIPACMADMSEILDNYDEGGEIQSNLNECLLWGVLSILIVSVLMIPNIKKQLQQENTIQILQAAEL